uniref:IS4/Tn5 family transposase DNA-binding protein n=1 Tax=Novosphingobium sp. B-7 TaxID=1298855 RepID=UPI0005BAD71F
MSELNDEHGSTAGHWSRGEVDEKAFKDARLGRRFGDLLCRLSNRMGGTIPLACQDWASTKAAYRFFANPKGKRRSQ